MEIIARPYYTDKVRKYYGKGVIVAITGQRRVGKSSILQQLVALTSTTDNAIYINKEDRAFWNVRNESELCDYVDIHLEKGKNNFLFVDEVQDIEGFEHAIRSIHAQDKCNIVLTGSNARMLSGELSTFLSGRHVEIRVFPLNYLEFLFFHKIEDNDGALLKYLQYGGLPQLARIGLEDKELVGGYLDGIINTVLVKDVIEHNKIRNVTLLKMLLAFIADNIGKQFSARSISNYLKGQKIDTSPSVILSYLQFMCSAFLINVVKRYDIHGKRVFETGDKYYFEDIGVRNRIVGPSRANDIEKVMENVVYLHLRSLGYVVYVGQLMNTEIDFVARDANGLIYVQVAYLLASEETIDREFGNLKLIDDNYPKYVVSMDRFYGAVDEDGIKHIHLRQFLKMKASELD